MLKSINHICFSVRDLSDSIHFYRDILLGELLSTDKRIAYSKLAGLQTTLNGEKDIPRNKIHFPYTHIAFAIDDSELRYWHQRLRDNDMNILEGRVRDVRDRQLIYFTDSDGHKLEPHTDTFENRLNYYKKAKPHMTSYR